MFCRVKNALLDASCHRLLILNIGLFQSFVGFQGPLVYVETMDEGNPLGFCQEFVDDAGDFVFVGDSSDVDFDVVFSDKALCFEVFILNVESGILEFF